MSAFEFKKPPVLQPRSGDLLIADPFLLDENFSRTVIFLCEHSEEGTVGFVLNQPTALQLSDVVEDYNFAGQAIFQGGPVEHDTLHMLHNIPEVLEGKRVISELYWGGMFEELSTLAKPAHQKDSRIKMFLGYSGWSPGQLEKELEEGSWLVAEANSDIVFYTDVEDIWKKSIELLGKEYAYLAGLPLNPQLN